MDIEQLLTTTRSARKTLDLDAQVDLDEIRDCLRIGLHAANGSNQQSWRWLIITDPEKRAKIGDLYRTVYLGKVGGQFVANLMPEGTPERRLMSSTEWLAEHMGEVPALVIPCYEPSYPRQEGDESFYQATLYGSIFPAVWNFTLALRAKGYGTCVTTLHLHEEAAIRDLLEIPESYVQGCLLPVAKLRRGVGMHPTPRREPSDVVAVNGW